VRNGERTFGAEEPPLPPERRQELEKATPPCKVMPGGEGIAYFSHDDGRRLAAIK